MYTLQKNTTAKLNIVFLRASDYTDVSALGWGTPFTGLRYVVPKLMGFKGKAIYMDMDETIDGADRSCKRVLPRKMSKAGAAAAAEYLRQSRHLRPLRRAQTEARRLIKSTPNSSGSLRGKAKDGEKRFSHL